MAKIIRIIAVNLFIVHSLCSSLASATCWDYAASKFDLDRDILMAIAYVESGLNPAAMNYSHIEKTGSYDIGLMQINSRWLKKIPIDEQELKQPCNNILVAAWILSDLIKRMGPNWEVVGAYNSSCTKLKGQACLVARTTYVKKVKKVYLKIKESNRLQT